MRTVIIAVLLAFSNVAHSEDVCELFRTLYENDDVYSFIENNERQHEATKNYKKLSIKKAIDGSLYEYELGGKTRLVWRRYYVGSAICQKNEYMLTRGNKETLVDWNDERFRNCDDAACCDGSYHSYFTVKGSLYNLDYDKKSIEAISLKTIPKPLCSFDVIRKRPLQYRNYAGFCSDKSVCDSIIKSINAGNIKAFDILRGAEGGIDFPFEKSWFEDSWNTEYNRCIPVDFNNDKLTDAVCAYSEIAPRIAAKKIEFYINSGAGKLELFGPKHLAPALKGSDDSFNSFGDESRSDDEYVPSEVSLHEHNGLTYFVTFDERDKEFSFGVYLVEHQHVERIGGIKASSVQKPVVSINYK